MNLVLPMATLAALTLAVLVLVPYRRFRAGRAGTVRYEDFRYGESDRVPPAVTLANRNLMNLLELPVLFYVACLALLVLAREDDRAANLAWAYVALRFAHSAIHLSYNEVRHRLVVFALSNVVLVMLWTHLLRTAAR